MIICFAFGIVVCIVYRLYLIYTNKQRDQARNGAEAVDAAELMLNLMDKTDRQIPQFRYVY
jgi:hypothetical protein